MKVICDRCKRKCSECGRIFHSKWNRIKMMLCKECRRKLKENGDLR